MSDNEYSDEEHGFGDDGVGDSDWQEGEVDDGNWQEGEVDDGYGQESVDDNDSVEEDIEQETGEDEINEADDDRDKEKQSQSCHQYPRYPAYVEAKVEMKMSNISLNENGEEKKRAAQKTKQ